MEAATASPDFERPLAGRSGPGRPAELLAEFFDAHAPMVLGLCRSLLRDAHDAEDAAQQTFVSAFASLIGGTLPREPAAWLATIARNECRTRAQRRMREPLPLPEAGVGVPAVEPVSVDDVESLRLAVANLPRQQRDAFLLREFSGLSYEELSFALGVSLPAVESLLFRARRQLRMSLRPAAATAIAFPAAARDFVAQLFAGSGESPAALAKLTSVPVLAKIASVGAGAALMTAGAVAVAPHRDRRAAPKLPRASAAIAPRRHTERPARRAVLTQATPVAHQLPSAPRVGDARQVTRRESSGRGDDAAPALRPEAESHDAPVANHRHGARAGRDDGSTSPTPQDMSSQDVVEQSASSGSDGSDDGGDAGASSGSGDSSAAGGGGE